MQDDLTVNHLLELFPLKITIPPLRQRKEELGSLMHHILESVNKQLNRKVSGFSFETFYFFIGYNWPNNVDELRSEVEGAVTLTKDHDLIRPEVLSGRLIRSQKLLKTNHFSR
jgi:transcriptional regulator with PAS, ATPase and Fis domain